MSAPGPNRRPLGYDNWRTPSWLVRTVDAVFSGQVVDISARTEEDSALPYRWKPIGDVWERLPSLEGSGVVAFCNPPYGRELPKWVDFVTKYSIPVLWLVPASTDTQWFKKLWLQADLVVFFTGRLKFTLRGKDEEKSAATIGSALIATKFLHSGGHPVVKLIDTEEEWQLRLILMRFLREGL